MGWEDGDWHVYFWNGSTVTRIESEATYERFPDISGTRVVWSGRDGSAANDAEIYFWDGGEVVQLTDNDADDGQPAVSGTDIVWVSNVDGDYEVFFASVPLPAPVVPAVPVWGIVCLAASLAAAGAIFLGRRAVRHAAESG